MPSESEILRWKWNPQMDDQCAQRIRQSEPLIEKVLRRETRRAVMTAAVLAGGAAFGVYVAASRTFADHWASFAAALALVLAVPAFMYARTTGSPWRNALKSAECVEGVSTLEAVEISASFVDEGVRIDGRDGTRIYPWHLFGSAINVESGVDLRFSHALNGVHIPQRAFADTDACERFAHMVNSRLRDLQEHEEDKVRRTLGTATLACPTCRYTVQATPRPECSECGTAISMVTLSCMKALGVLPSAIEPIVFGQTRTKSG